jgi:hypothetical protein
VMADDPDEELIERVKTILGERLNAEGGLVHTPPISKEGRAVVMLKTLQRLLSAKERRDIDEVIWTRAHLEALLKEDDLRKSRGRPQNQDREEILAREFQARRRRTPDYVSDSKLMEQIGRQQLHGQELKRSQAIKVIRRGLKKLSAKTD